MKNLNKLKCWTPLLFVYVCCLLSCTKIQKKPENSIKKDSTAQQNNIQIAHDTAVYGIDISHYQGVINWNETNHITFAICKATQGITYIDPNFQSNWSALHAQKIIRGAYHFYMDNDDPMAQTQNFLSSVTNYSKNDLPLIIDIENGSLKGTTKSNIAIVENLLVMLQNVEEETNITPIIYTNTNFAETHLSDPRLKKYPLWIADYSNTQEPIVPAPWETGNWLFWQKTDRYTLNPNNKDIDYDVFNGSLEELQKITKK